MGMKKIILSMLLALSLVGSASAFDLWFKWTANPSNDLVTSYVIQQAVGTSTNFVDTVTAPGTTNVWVIRSLANGSYKFRIVAVNGAGRSIPSNVLSYPTNAPGAPSDFQFTNPQ